MAKGGGTEIERLHATVGVDLSELRTGLAAAQSETRAATSDMAGSFDRAATGIDAANKKIERSSRGAARGTSMLGIQFSQLGTQLATGTNAAVAFGQQLPDIAFGLQGATGAAGRFASFMLGPWGAALTTAGVLVGVLAEGLFEAADASDEAKDAANELTEAENRLANATAAANHQTRQGILDDIARANSLRTRTQETLRLLMAERERNMELMDRQRAGELGISRAELAAMGGTVTNDAEIARLQQRIDDLGTDIRAGERQVADRDIAAQLDPTVAANQRYEDAVDRAARAYDEGTMTLDAYRAVVIREARARDSTIETLEESERAERGSRSSRTAADRAATRAAREREQVANRAYRLDNAYQRQLASAQSGLLSAQMDLADGYEERAELERQMVQARYDREEEEILTNRDLDEVQKARLLAILDNTRALQMQSIAIDEARQREAEMDRRWQTMMEVQEIRRETELDLLSQQYDAARTMEDRQRIALQIVQAEHDLAAARYREIIASANRVLASEEATDAEKLAAEAARARAQAQLEGLGATLPGRKEEARRNNRTILDAEGFGRALGDNLESAILAALRGKNLKDALKDGLFNLLHDAIGDAFANLSKVAFGEQGLGGVLGGLFSSIFGGNRAVGGPAIGGMAYNVGDGEKFVPSTNGRILSRTDAMAAAGGGGTPFQLAITISGARGNQEIMDMVRAGVQEGIGQYDRVVGDRVNSSLKRRA